MITATEKLSPSDLQHINNLTMTEMEADNLFVFSAKFIDDAPTSNGRIWSKEWQVKNVGQFVGLPVTVNHENDQTLVLGRIFAAEQKDNAITGKVFIPLVNDANRETKQKIEAGLFKSVSINASASNTKREGKHTRILPGDDDRVFEVSFVAVGGCKTCVVSGTESLTESCVPAQESAQWIEFAKSAHAEAAGKFIRAAAFAIGDGFSKETYEDIATRLDPKTLSTITNDFKRVCEDRKERAESGDSPADQVKEAVQRIKTAKGI